MQNNYGAPIDLSFECCRPDPTQAKISDHSRKENLMTAMIARRFVELEQQLEEILASKTHRNSSYTGSSYEHIESDRVLNWGVKVKSLFERLGSETASQLKTFIEAEEYRSFDSEVDRLKRLRAIFLATKEDFEGGYLVSYRNLVQAEVFSNELEQAEELFRNGYATAAAVIAGVVLETTLRDLCSTHELEHGSLNKMNDDLAKTGAYNASQKKRITALAAIRNSAAHGKPEEFTAADVRGMIDDVERFLASTLQ
jgi:AcrR family transcriptional regulator